MDITIDAFITEMEVKFNKVYTAEQREFIKNITNPTFVFASPGTGKTQSAVGALITAELYNGIPGDTIYALSFTNKATSELQVRHKLACDKLGIKQRVQFMTLHKLCSDLLSKNYMQLGMSSYTPGDPMSPENLHKYIMALSEEHHISLREDKVRQMVNTIKRLNTQLIFDRDHITSTADFRNLDIDYDSFSLIRKRLYMYSVLVGKVPVSDILIYTLQLLREHDNLSKEFKSKCRIMLVDEAQDLSLLQLALVNSFTDCPVLIGDQKQQIYGFQGACPEIKREFFKLHPEARELTLSQSFRCSNEIANYATPLILKNNVGGAEFTGCGDGGIVEEVYGMDNYSICANLLKDFSDNNGVFTKDVLFLYRNNYSAMPLIEELYKQGIPFRSYKYPGATNIPFVKEMCQIINFLRSPTTQGLDYCLRYLIPEFRGTTGQTPLLKIATELGCNPLEVNYAFKNEEIGANAMEALVTVDDYLKKGESMTKIFEVLWPVLYRTWGVEQEKYMDKPAKYYLALAAPVVQGKTFDKFVSDEREKEELLKKYENLRIGVRCYTMHASKGLEADIVHILDADEGILPNDKIMDRYLKRGCYEDAAKAIRNERSLVYVACTRARKELYIHYSGTMSKLFDPLDTSYDKLDLIYEAQDSVYEDINAFDEFYKEGGDA